MSSEVFQVLIVDDDPAIRTLIGEILGVLPVNILEAGRADDALELTRHHPVHFALVDLKLPDSSGIKLVELLVEEFPDLAICILSGTGDISSAVKAMRLGAVDFLQKPAKPEVILNRVRQQVEIWNLKNENQRLRETQDFSCGFNSLVGTSKVMRNLKEIIIQVAHSDATVLIQGETGTGKELVARAIHKRSNRRDNPFVPVDCASINETMIESELFGHEKGAFTGAHIRREGLIRSALGGTIFLDEISEIPTTLQVKLLRVLQERQVRSVGASFADNVDVRVISATNRNLETEVNEGRFREDLMYRLNVITLDVPPLRSRSDDIPVLIQHFLDSFRSSHSRVRRLAPEVVDLMIAYRWPGNIRQLENVIRRIDALTIKEVAGVEDLPPDIRKGYPSRGKEERRGIDRNQTLDMTDVEKQTIRDALRVSEGNRRRAAEILGISEATLYRKIKKYMLP